MRFILESARLGRHLGASGARFKLVLQLAFTFLLPVSRPDPRGRGKGSAYLSRDSCNPGCINMGCRGLHSRDDFFRHFLEVRDFVETDDITYLHHALLAPGQWQCKRSSAQRVEGPKGRFDTGIKPLLGNLELLGQYHVTEQIGDYGRARQQSGIRRDVLDGASRPKE